MNKTRRLEPGLRAIRNRQRGQPTIDLSLWRDTELERAARAVLRAIALLEARRDRLAALAVDPTRNTPRHEGPTDPAEHPDQPEDHDAEDIRCH